MKKKLVMGSLVLVLLLLTACGGEPQEEEGAAPEAKTEYQNKVKGAIDNSNKLLAVYNKSVDQLYTEELSNEEFGNMMRTNIEKSNEMVRSIDEMTPDPTFFEIHQAVITLMNNQHQMFLDAVEMANEDKIEKDNLRKEYLSIKTEQQKIINGLRTL
ncbi:hypothetical protein IQ283_08185 (plasmid) [Alkalihalobacillus hwajinpoensis]|uniref:hypothetical protein n=1 Tax=Guptibacillus hwajinpoensis TaxID=208199 RepID=UPI00188451CB|nr:hypothetical protein [Pseudalkalibacillus hwajinpoensis]MBF0706587.1 hypothetical protein [Pseudalkalibacillus hwajinpoensis]